MSTVRETLRNVFCLPHGAIYPQGRICAETSVSNALRAANVSLAYQIGFSLARVIAAIEQQNKISSVAAV